MTAHPLLRFASRAMRGRAALWAGPAALLIASAAHAQDGAAQLSQIGQRFVDAALQQPAADAPPSQLPLRMEVKMGQLDPRLRLAACARVEPYLPAGSRLWGKTRLGLRCAEGAVAWNVYLPITVHAYGPAWVAQSHVPAGRVLSADDLMPAEVDWAEESAAVFARAEDAIGMITTRPLAAGQALRQNMVRPAPLFTAGAPVQVMVDGGSFHVSASGKALSAAGQGQQVRVRMDNGRLVTGTVNASGVVVVP